MEEKGSEILRVCVCMCVCAVINRTQCLYYLLVSDTDESSWPALWTESQAREFKNRHPWLEWRDRKLGKCQHTCKVKLI